MSRTALASLARSAAPGSIRLTRLARLFAEAEEQLSQIEAGRRLRRAALFRESLPQSVRRHLLAVAYSVSPKRAAGLLPMWRLLLRDTLTPPAGLPDPGSALADPDGLCGIPRDLSVDTLIEAYSRGLYPLCHVGPLKWWAPRTRSVAHPADIVIGKSARRHLKRGTFRLTFDRDFDAVIAACAGPRRGHVPLTWITPKMSVGLCGVA